MEHTQKAEVQDSELENKQNGTTEVEAKSEEGELGLSEEDGSDSESFISSSDQSGSSYYLSSFTDSSSSSDEDCEQYSSSDEDNFNNSNKSSTSNGNKSYEWVKVNPPEEELNTIHSFNVNNIGIKNSPPQNSPAIDYFSLFFTNEVWDMLVEGTNNFAHRLIQQKTAVGALPPHSKFHNWVDVTCKEMKKFIAVLINSGLAVVDEIKYYWSTNPTLQVPWFQSMMSYERFSLILSLLQSESHERRAQSGCDHFARVRKLLHTINQQLKIYFIPSQKILIQECKFKIKDKMVYIHSQPDEKNIKFGFNKFEICDAETGYVLHYELYNGKNFLKNGNDRHVESKQKIIIDLLTKTGLLGKYYHLFTDFLYSTPSLATLLWEKNTYLTGTVNSNTKHIPKTIMQTNLEPTESVYFRKGPILLVSYKQKHRRKPTHIITTGCHAEDKMCRGRGGKETLKPVIVNEFDQIISKVNKDDVPNYIHTSVRPVAKYWNQVFNNLVDICLFNSYILYSKNTTKPRSKYNYTVQLIEELVKEELKISSQPQIDVSQPPIVQEKMCEMSKESSASSSISEMQSDRFFEPPHGQKRSNNSDSE